MDAISQVHPRPHDFVWVSEILSFEGDKQEWVEKEWSPDLPVVVRRDRFSAYKIPVGIRGSQRKFRQAAWIDPKAIQKIVTPKELLQKKAIQKLSFKDKGPIKALLMLLEQKWSFSLGVTGGCAYSIATEKDVLNPTSDLDLWIDAPSRIQKNDLEPFISFLKQLPCRADVQIETPKGAFSLFEWIKSERVLLKTNTGPFLTEELWDE